MVRPSAVAVLALITQFILGRLLDREIDWASAPQDYVEDTLPDRFTHIRGVRHQTPRFGERFVAKCTGQPISIDELDDPIPFSEHQRVTDEPDRAGPPRDYGVKDAVKILGPCLAMSSGPEP
jgi:hypothetical protein